MLFSISHLPKVLSLISQLLSIVNVLLLEKIILLIQLSSKGLDRPPKSWTDF